MYISGLLDLYMQRVAYIDGTRCIYSSNNKLFQPVPAQQFLHCCIRKSSPYLQLNKLIIIEQLTNKFYLEDQSKVVRIIS